MNNVKKMLKEGLVAATCLLAACGDSGNSQTAENTTSHVVIPDTTTAAPIDTSSTEPGNEAITDTSTQDTSTLPPVDVQDSAKDTVQTIVPPQQLVLSFEEEMARDSLFVAASADTGFATIESVYKNLAADERVVFLIRHAKRITDTSKEATLVYAGVVQSQNVGAKLISDEPFAYGHTDFVRTQSTAENIAIGRGETFPGSVVIPEMTENWYIKDAEKLAVYDSLHDPSLIYSQWAYNNTYADAFYDLKERCVRAITEVIIPQMSTTTRINIFVSHDMFIGPLTVYCTNGKVNRLRYWETDQWVYFVSGIAIIVKPNGERRYIPIDGVEYDT